MRTFNYGSGGTTWSCNRGYDLSSAGKCELRRCYCDHGTPALGDKCTAGGRACRLCSLGFELDAKLCAPSASENACGGGNHEKNCTSCHPGFHLVIKSTANRQHFVCSPNKCFCANGKPAIGAKCERDKAERCLSCLPGYSIGFCRATGSPDQCVQHRCACENGVGEVGRLCPRSGAEACKKCTVAGYDLLKINSSSSVLSFGGRGGEDEDDVGGHGSTALVEGEAGGGVENCPKECHSPLVKAGGSWNGGRKLKNGSLCVHFASRPHGGTRYCGAKIAKGKDPAAYTKGGVDCRPCAASCPKECHSPLVKAGGSWNGGRKLKNGSLCVHFASRPHGGTRYCGAKIAKGKDPHAYSKGGVDCRPCAASTKPKHATRTARARRKKARQMITSFCRERVCFCDNGTPAMGAGCPKTGTKSCSGCLPGFVLRKNETDSNGVPAGSHTALVCTPGPTVCMCPHGEPAHPCPALGVHCRKCFPGFHLAPASASSPKEGGTAGTGNQMNMKCAPNSCVCEPIATLF